MINDGMGWCIFWRQCDGAEKPTPDFVHGTSLVPVQKNPKVGGHTAVASKGNAQRIRTDQYRLVAHKGGADVFKVSHAKNLTSNV